MVEKVIEQRVRPAINAITGRMVTIPFVHMIPEATIPHPTSNLGAMSYAQIYRIPPERRDHAEITSIIRVVGSVGHFGMTTAFPPYTSSKGNSIHSLGALALGVLTQGDAHIGPFAERLGPDIIRVTPSLAMASSYDLECTLAYNHDFMDMPSNLWESFAKAVMVATKSYIYNEQFIDIDSAKLSGGQALGAYKEVVDTYRDEGSYEKFIEAIDQLAGSEMFSQNNLERTLYYML